jgi:hypothetical protein
MKSEIMYYYQVGYWSYEECPIHTLKHEQEFTQQQFDELVSDCIVRVYKSQKDYDMDKSIESSKTIYLHRGDTVQMLG